MKLLAEYVMAGPRQAAVVCLGFGFVPIFGPWLCAAALALVVLQLGVNPALKVLPWALIPSFAWLILGDTSLLLMLCAVFISAIVLRWTSSLSQALLTSVGVSAFAFLLAQTMYTAQVEKVSELVGQYLSQNADLSQLVQSDPEHTNTKEFEKKDEVIAPTKPRLTEDELGKLVIKLAKMALAFAAGLSACLVLFLARWWQAVLYRPGAFQTEFHSLGLSRRQLVLLFLAITILPFGLESIFDSGLGQLLIPLLVIPVFLSGIALVHSLVTISGLSSHWLGVFYIALLFGGHLLFALLILVALADVIVDFRGRLRRSKTS